MIDSLDRPTNHYCLRKFVLEHCKDHLRKAQSKESAQVYVSRGVEQFKKGECQQALNYYNQALDLDNENVDALVARGALYNSR